MGAEGYDAPSTSQQRTKQQTSSRMMKTTRRGRPYAKVSLGRGDTSVPVMSFSLTLVPPLPVGYP